MEEQPAQEIKEKVTKAKTPDLSDREIIDLCKAGIAALYKKPLENVLAEEQEDGSISVSYHRPSDGKLWQYKCRIVKDRIHWGTTDGRWRTHSLDEALYFTYDAEKEKAIIRVEYPDSTEEKEYLFGHAAENNSE